MKPAVSCVFCLLTLASVWAGEYCDDFENGDFGEFWTQSSQDTGGAWKPSSYVELKKTISDFPEPVSGDTIVYLTPAAQSSYMSARLQMKADYSFPDGSTISFRYWLRSQWQGSGTFEVRRVVGSKEEPNAILSLTETSGPSNADWIEVNVTIPTDDKDFKLLVFGACGTGDKNNIAIDDIKVCGPAGLNQQCLPLTTTTVMTTTAQPTTTEPATTTELATTSEPTTTAEPTTPTEPTTTEPTTTEPATTSDPTTTTESTATTELATTTKPITSTEPTTTPEPTTTHEPTTVSVPTTHTPTAKPTATADPTTVTEPTSVTDTTGTAETITTTAPATATGTTTTPEPLSTTELPSTPQPPATTESTRPPVTTEPPTVPPTVPQPTPSDRRLGPSGLLWAVFAVLGSSLVLLLLLVLGWRRIKNQRSDQLPLVRQASSASDNGSSSGGNSSGWYGYIIGDRWQHAQDKVRRLHA